MIKETRTIICDVCNKDARISDESTLDGAWGYTGAPIFDHYCSKDCLEKETKLAREYDLEKANEGLKNYKQQAKEVWDELKNNI